jgi:hypothetical protein
MKKQSLIGMRFGRLTVINDTRIMYGEAYYSASECLCDCGGRKTTSNTNLKKGLTKSCGCIQKEFTIKRCTKHGLKTRNNPHPIYRTWTAMHTRCSSPKCKNWADYGGRGITVCSEWNDFESFSSDMLPSWKRGLSLDRIDNAKGYSKENCKWSTSKEQNSNKRNVHPVSFGGETRTLADWGRYLGGTCDLIYVRLKRGWTMERALSTPA